jgi:hypothetical protein
MAVVCTYYNTPKKCEKPDIFFNIIYLALYLHPQIQIGFLKKGEKKWT